MNVRKNIQAQEKGLDDFIPNQNDYPTLKAK